MKTRNLLLGALITAAVVVLPSTHSSYADGGECSTALFGSGSYTYSSTGSSYTITTFTVPDGGTAEVKTNTENNVEIGDAAYAHPGLILVVGPQSTSIEKREQGKHYSSVFNLSAGTHTISVVSSQNNGWSHKITGTIVICKPAPTTTTTVVVDTTLPPTTVPDTTVVVAVTDPPVPPTQPAVPATVLSESPPPAVSISTSPVPVYSLPATGTSAAVMTLIAIALVAIGFLLWKATKPSTVNE